MGKFKLREVADFEEALRWCNKNGYTIYPVPIGAGTWKSPPKCYIEINYFGKTKPYDEVYKQDSKVYDVIRQYYVAIYKKKKDEHKIDK